MADIAAAWASLRTQPLIYWVAGSVLASALATNLLWLLRKRVRLPDPQRALLSHAVRLPFYLGVPYLALGGWPRPPFSGLVSLADMGLVGFGPPWPATRWLGSFGAGVGLGIGAFLILLLAWRNAGRPPFPSRPGWMSLVEGLGLQVHWAFYRGALATLTGSPYAGVWLGLALVCLEWALDPFWRSGWREPGQATERWLRASLALVAAILFLVTRSLWVCLGVHWAVEPAFGWMARERRIRATGGRTRTSRPPS